jgi:hypothetical protein
MAYYAVDKDGYGYIYSDIPVRDNKKGSWLLPEKGTFNGELKQVDDLNWNELTSFTKSRLLKFMSELLILKHDYALTENQRTSVDNAEARLIEYISRANK